MGQHDDFVAEFWIFQFEVKACNDARVSLAHQPGSHTYKAINVLIGTNNNERVIFQNGTVRSPPFFVLFLHQSFDYFGFFGLFPAFYHHKHVTAAVLTFVCQISPLHH